MKSGLMAISALMLFALLAGPVAAIGPQKAEKNPRIMITPEGAELLLPSGVMMEWTADTEIWYLDFVHALDASKAKIRNAMPLTIEDLMELMTDPECALEAENKWGYVSYEVLVDLLMLEGLTREEAEGIAAMWPEGVYVMFVNVGK